MNTLSGILQLVIAISALIVLHELGHFIVARLMGIEVEEFGLGYPPRALTLFEAGGTKFTLNWLPLGGFVRPKGENNPDIEGGLAASKPLKRISVYFAGPLMNILAGVILYTIIFSRLGTPDTSKVLVLEVVDNSPAAVAGLETGDQLLQVNNIEVDSTLTLHEAIYDNLGEEISLTYERDGTTNTINLVPREDPPKNEGAIGILMGNPTTPVSWIEALPTGFSATGEHIYTLVTLPAQVARGTISGEDARLVGYKGMYDIYQEVREQEPIPGTSGNINVLGFFTTITLSLGILNLMPIPALDGGRILFTLPELLFRKRIPPEFENWVNLISFTLLIGLFIYINILDFTNPIQLP
ncbi:MAG: PDZ domain-containing protein [Gammaproteobacteria bacterium]|nr:PDZ domain-containing protein [Gammaproteobacteria bacterium]